MKNGICPKCNDTQVYYRKGEHSIGNSIEQIQISPKFFSKGVVPDKYICTSCGYIEYYLALEKDLTEIKDNWEKVSPKN